MLKLKLMGYWHSYEEIEYPDPAWFVDPLWETSEREIVINYLKSGVEFRGFCGISWCRFRCKENDLGSKELTDGFYYWPEGFIHYLEIHYVKPPQEFLDHVKKNPVINEKKLNKIVKRELNREIELAIKGKKSGHSFFRCDERWWKNQKGHAKGKSFKTPGFGGFSGKLWLIDTEELNYKQIKFLRDLCFLQDYPISSIKSDLSHSERVLLEEKCEYHHAADLIKKARSQGLKFKIEMTRKFKST